MPTGGYSIMESMVTIAPTITTDDPAVYVTRLDEFLTFAPRIQIDITDGQFAPSRTINLNQVYWSPADKRTSKIDLHLMVKRPIEWLDQIVALVPDKVILHAESDDAVNMLPRIFAHLRRFGMAVGVALLPATQPESIDGIIADVDSVLIFGGHLGYQGGTADLTQLDKVAAIRRINPSAVIEWDGGANLDNIKQIATAGVTQINVGSAISSAADPVAAYRELVRAIESL